MVKTIFFYQYLPYRRNIYLSVLSVTYCLTHKSSTVEHHCTASVGVLIFKGQDKSEDELFNQAKEAGRNSIRFYDSNS